MKGRIKQTHRVKVSLEKRNEIALANRGLVGRIVQMFYRTKPHVRRHYPEEDAHADGFISLMRAAEMFDPRKGIAFSTYAWYWISQGLQRGYARQGFMIHAPHGREDFRPSPTNDAFALEKIQGDCVWEEVERRDVQGAVSESFRVLHEREALIVRRRMNGDSLKQIAEELRITPERVRQIQLRAHAKLTRVLERLKEE